MKAARRECPQVSHTSGSLFADGSYLSDRVLLRAHTAALIVAKHTESVRAQFKAASAQASCHDDTLCITNHSCGKMQSHLLLLEQAHKRSITSLAYSESQHMLFSGSYDSDIKASSCGGDGDV